MTADELMRLVNRYTEACDDLGAGLFNQTEAETNAKHAKAKELHGQILSEVYRLHTALDQARLEYEDLQQVTVNRSRNVALALRKLEQSHTGMSYGDEKAGELSGYTRGWGDCLAGVKKAFTEPIKALVTPDNL